MRSNSRQWRRPTFEWRLYDIAIARIEPGRRSKARLSKFFASAATAKPNRPSGRHASGEFRKDYGNGNREPTPK